MNKETSYLNIVKRFLILLGLFIISPITLSLSFKSFKIYNTYPKLLISYLLLLFGILFVAFTLYFGLKTIQKLLNILFK